MLGFREASDRDRVAGRAQAQSKIERGLVMAATMTDESFLEWIVSTDDKRMTPEMSVSGDGEWQACNYCGSNTQNHFDENYNDIPMIDFTGRVSATRLLSLPNGSSPR